MSYGIVICVDNKHYLEVSKDNCIRAFEYVEEATDTFRNFSNSYFSGNYESYISSGMGLISLKPRVIKLPEDPNELKEYFLKDTVTGLKGQGFGYFIDTAGIEVDEKIEEIVVVDIANTIIIKNEKV